MEPVSSSAGEGRKKGRGGQYNLGRYRQSLSPAFGAGYSVNAIPGKEQQQQQMNWGRTHIMHTLTRIYSEREIGRAALARTQ